MVDYLAYLEVFLLLIIVSTCEGKKLPALLTEDDQFYRFMNEIELLESGKVSV